MIDLHCHFLPGVDDGARTMTDALALASAAVANGITRSLLTPHVYPGVFDNRLSSLRPVFASYQTALREARIPLEVHLGGEVRLHPDAFELLQGGELPIFGLGGGQGTVLVELPDNRVPVGAVEACRAFGKQGIRCLIAHPERNKEVMRDPMRLKPLIQSGCLLQLTAASVVGSFGKPAFQTAHQLLGLGWVAVVASDAHNLAHRPPVMREARDLITRRYGAGLACRLTEETAEAILTGL